MTSKIEFISPEDFSSARISLDTAIKTRAARLSAALAVYAATLPNEYDRIRIAAPIHDGHPQTQSQKGPGSDWSYVDDGWNNRRPMIEGLIDYLDQNTEWDVRSSQDANADYIVLVWGGK